MTPKTMAVRVPGQQVALPQMQVEQSEPLPEDELLDAEGEEYGDEGSDVIEVGEQFIDEESAEPVDENIYQDFGPGGDQPQSSYYGGGGGGGGYAPQPQPAATVAPTACPDGLPPSSYDPTTGAAICTRTVTPATPLPSTTPKEVRKFVESARAGLLDRATVAKAAQAAKDAGMPAAAGKIVQVGNRLMTQAPTGGTRGGEPQPVSKASTSGGGSKQSTPITGPKVAPKKKKPVPSRRLRGLEETMSGSYTISEVGIGDLGDEAEEFLYSGGDVYGSGPFTDEGQVPGYEMDDSGDYMQPDMMAPEESYAPAQSYAPSYGPAPQQYMPSYGYPQQQMPYGMDPYGGQYVPQGYSPYGQQGYGYDPYAQGGYYDPYAQAGAGYDPYGTGESATSLFPAGTPQIIIDTATAIMNGTATLQQVQQAVQTATSMGYAAVANQLIAMYQQYGGQYTAADGTTGTGGGRYCKAGEDPATAGCIQKEGTGTTKFGPLPQDGAGCLQEYNANLKNAAVKSAMTKIKNKSGSLTPIEKAYMARQSQLLACIKAAGGGKAVRGPSTPGAGIKTKRGLATLVYRTLYITTFRKCAGSGKKCDGGNWQREGNGWYPWQKKYKAMMLAAANVPADTVDPGTVAKVVKALQDAVKEIQSSSVTGGWMKKVQAVENALKAAKITVVA